MQTEIPTRSREKIVQKEVSIRALHNLSIWEDRNAYPTIQ